MPKTVVSIRKRSEPPSLTESALVRAWPMWPGLTQYWASGASPPGFHFPMLPTTPKLPILISLRYTTRHRVFMKMRDKYGFPRASGKRLSEALLAASLEKIAAQEFGAQDSDTCKNAVSLGRPRES